MVRGRPASAVLAAADEALLQLDGELPGFDAGVGLEHDILEIGLDRFQLRLGVPPGRLGARLDLRLDYLDGLGLDTRVGGDVAGGVQQQSAKRHDRRASGV